MSFYNIYVDGELLVEEVPSCDLKHKMSIIRSYCKLDREYRNSTITYEEINNPETIAWFDL